MKKFLAGICAACLLVTGCGGDTSEPAQVDKATIGVIAHLNASETEYNEHMQKLEESYRPPKANLSAQYKYFDTMNDMMLALDAGQVDMISTYRNVAEYVLKNSAGKEILPAEKNLSDSFCFAVRKGDTMLKNDLNKAIREMETDGTLIKLSKQYIIDLKIGAEPPAVTIEKIDDADTLKVAVTGDLPPFDMVLADGTPAGFSTAVLSEVSKRIGKNIELVQVAGGARAAALTSEQVDIVFWVAVPKAGNLIPANIDKPAGIDLTEPYYSDNIVYVGLKK